jgi:hypothetical protein
MRIKRATFYFLLMLFFLGIVSSGFAQEKEKRNKPFLDTLDRAFDLSYYLYNLHGFLPIISPITEPAIGYGAVLAGTFFLPKKETGDKKFRMPDVIGFGGGYTENKTWFAGAGYFGFWKDDHIRYRGVAGYGDVNLRYYGKGSDFLNSHPANFSIKAFGFVQQATFRIRESRFMLGGKYVFTKTKVYAFEDSKLPWVDTKEFDLTNSGAGLIVEYENLDNIFSPNKGFRGNITYNQYLEIIGSDRNFGKITGFALYYLPLFAGKWISGFRLESQMATGNPPFYAYPFIYLRGIPAMRYQGKYTALAETEQLVMLTRRWGVNGFAGYGMTFNDNKNGNTTWNAGVGFRYLIARVMGLRMGIDVAMGPEEWAFYVVFGSSWLK